jgi:hypothetical protein
VKLKDLVKPLSEQTDQELQDRLREIRHRRETVKPARAKIVERAETKTERKKVAKVQDLLEGMTLEEKMKLIQQLTEGSNSE